MTENDPEETFEQFTARRAKMQQDHIDQCKLPDCRICHFINTGSPRKPPETPRCPLCNAHGYDPSLNTPKKYINTVIALRKVLEDIMNSAGSWAEGESDPAFRRFIDIETAAYKALQATKSYG